MTAPDGPAADASEREEELYDAYVEAALAGAPPDPVEFLRERGAPDSSAVLLERLRNVHRTANGTDSPSPAATAPFARLGKYRVLRRLDEGGMGMVLLGEEEGLGRLVALKVLRPELQGSPTLAARFEREAQVVGRLRHPHIVTIYGVGEEQGTRFLAMEYVEGEGLDEAIARAKAEGAGLPVETCVRWAIQVAGALQAAHEAGVVHRDVKPSNIRITPAGDAVLLDFGIATEEGSSKLTATGRFLGTTAYAAPEQLRAAPGTEADARADVWALGVVLHEALTGDQPFDAPTDAGAIGKVLDTEAPPLRRIRRRAPRDLETVLQVALEKDPARRYASAAAFAEDLHAVLSVRPISGRRAGPLRRASRFARRHPAATVAVVLVLAGISVGLVLQESQRRAGARTALTSARSSIEAFRAECDAAREAEIQFAWLDEMVESQFMTAEEEARLNAAEQAVVTSRRLREAAFHDALAHLSRADRLGAADAEVERVRGALFVERWREARSRSNEEEAGFYRQLAVQHAGEGALPEDLAGTKRMEFRCTTPGATARLFHHVLLTDLDPAAEPRYVPQPLLAESPLQPGIWAFRLLADHAPLQTGDLVLRVGGEPPDESNWRELAAQLEAGARVEVHGRTLPSDLALPPGAPIRITTRPLAWPSDGEALGRGPLELPKGDLLLVVRAPGYEEARQGYNLWNDAPELVEITLRPLRTTPEGFVHVRPVTTSAPEFWIGETELTVGDYVEYLNDPATRAEIDASERPIRFPRSPASLAGGGHLTRNADGRFTLPSNWSADLPALGVSFEDAQAYCAWWTRRAAARGGRFRARLPTREHWVHAAGVVPWKYVFGNRFHPKWVSSCYARARAAPTRVLSHPRDETATGLFDTSGSLFEWMDEWWDETDGERRLQGGSWARATRDTFKYWGGQGAQATVATDETGFRVVLEEVAE